MRAAMHCFLTLLTAAVLLAGESASAQQNAASQPVVLDSVVAVVNNSAILASDITEEMHLAVLEPATEGRPSTPAEALQRLISRRLIQQQIRQEDALVAQPSQKQIEERTLDLRRNLPACTRVNCASADGWAVFLATHGLTALDVENYMRARLEILAFIENRFRAGIRISQEEIDRYYRNSLIPQYARGEAIPPLSAVAPRIEEILLQQQVNALFSAWLDNLRKQGDVEIIDPEYEAAVPAAANGGQAK